jgi:hypothetical protein
MLRIFEPLLRFKAQGYGMVLTNQELMGIWVRMQAFEGHGEFDAGELRFGFDELPGLGVELKARPGLRRTFRRFGLGRF